MPGSFEDNGSHFPASFATHRDLEQGETEEDQDDNDDYDYDEEDDNFDDDLLATGEMRNVPF
jgi:phosphatidate phosphatase LPIN